MKLSPPVVLALFMGGLYLAYRYAQAQANTLNQPAPAPTPSPTVTPAMAQATTDAINNLATAGTSAAETLQQRMTSLAGQSQL